MLHLPVLVTTAEIFFCRPCTVSSANLLGLECRLLSISANSMYVSDVSVQRVYVRLSECCMILLCMWMIIYVCVYIYIYIWSYVHLSFPSPKSKGLCQRHCRVPFYIATLRNNTHVLPLCCWNIVVNTVLFPSFVRYYANTWVGSTLWQRFVAW